MKIKKLFCTAPQAGRNTGRAQAQFRSLRPGEARTLDQDAEFIEALRYDFEGMVENLTDGDGLRMDTQKIIPGLNLW